MVCVCRKRRAQASRSSRCLPFSTIQGESTNARIWITANVVPILLPNFEAICSISQIMISTCCVKKALIARFSLQPNEAGRITRTAVRELYGSGCKDPMFWLTQDCGKSTPLQRRYARRRYSELTQSSRARGVSMILVS